MRANNNGKRLLLLHFSVSTLLLATNVFAVDVTKREETDPLLEIKTGGDQESEMHSLLDLLNGDHRSSGVVRVHGETGVPTYRRLWGKSDVLMVHPIAPDQPGVVDFSGITKSSKGRLNVSISKHPWGNHLVKIQKNGVEVASQNIAQNDWETLRVDFDREDVVLQVHATGWKWENSFITYRIEKR
jgi:hypothetical protein